MDKKEINKITKEIIEEIEIINLLVGTFLKNKNILKYEELIEIRNNIFELSNELIFLKNKIQNS